VYYQIATNVRSFSQSKVEEKVIDPTDSLGGFGSVFVSSFTSNNECKERDWNVPEGTD
jgi:hypothetical protein